MRYDWDSSGFLGVLRPAILELLSTLCAKAMFIGNQKINFCCVEVPVDPVDISGGTFTG